MEQNNTIGTLLKNQREKKNISLEDGTVKLSFIYFFKK